MLKREGLDHTLARQYYDLVGVSEEHTRPSFKSMSDTGCVRPSTETEVLVYICIYNVDNEMRLDPEDSMLEFG